MSIKIHGSSIYFIEIVLITFFCILVLASCKSKNDSHETLSKELIHELSKIDHSLLDVEPENRIKKIQVIRTEAIKHQLDFPIAKSELSLAYIYQHFHDIPNFLKHALRAEEILKSQRLSSPKEQQTYAESLRLVGLGYMNSGHLDEALDYTQKAFKLLNSVKDSENSLIIKGLLHLLQVDIHKKSGQSELQYYHINKALEFFNKDKGSKWYPHLMANVYNEFADFYIHYDEVKTMESDLALLYIEKSLEISRKTKNPYPSGKSYKLLGDLYFVKKEYSEALQFYEKSEKLFTVSKKPIDKVVVFEKIKATYEKQGETNLENEYKAKYLELNDSIKNAKIDLQFLVSQHINEKVKTSIDSCRNKVMFFAFAFFIILILCFAFWKKKKKQINEFKKQISTKEKVINTQERIKNQLNDEINQLKQQNTEKLKELILNKDDRVFLTKFDEIYPDFIENLKLSSPDLTPSDLKFCALVKLNFSTKEIAEINYVTTKAIEIKRYRIRKKIDLDPKVNFETWIMSI